MNSSFVSLHSLTLKIHIIYTEVLGLGIDDNLILPGRHFAFLKELDDQEAGLFAEGEGELGGVGRGGSGH